jgi:sporulation protein YlmC with PRC-barrel domain
MEDIAGWIAPIATMIAAMMTAANLGARVTGSGFVVFTIGSICWSIVGLSTGQTNLVATNGFLTLVNLIGAWRWLGTQRKYEEGGKSAEQASRRCSSDDLFTATGLAGMPVDDAKGDRIGRVVEALVECSTGTISYFVISSGGIGGIDESLRAVSWDNIALRDERLVLSCDRTGFERLPVLTDGRWPAKAPAPTGR